MVEMVNFGRGFDVRELETGEVALFVGGRALDPDELELSALDLDELRD